VRDVLFAKDDQRVTVIPCCADLELVNSQEHLRGETRRRLGLVRPSASRPSDSASKRRCEWSARVALSSWVPEKMFHCIPNELV